MLRMFRLEYFFHLQTVLQPMWRLLELSDCKCVRIPPKFVNLGSVLQLLQLHWSKQCPPGQQRYRWDREVVAEPTPLQGIGPQRGECHPGPRSGEMIIFLSNCLMRGCGSRNGVNRVDFLLCSGVVEHLLCETGHGFLSARFQSTCMVPFTVGAASSPGSGGHVNNAASLPRIRSTPSFAGIYASIMTHACCTLALGLLKLCLQP